MSKAKLDGKFCFAMGAVFFLLLGLLWDTNPYLKMGDFKALYYASQALVHHQDPYSEATLRQFFISAPENLHLNRTLHAVTMCVNLPTTVVLLTPLALLPWGVAHWLWALLIAGSVIFAGYLMWNVSSSWSPRSAGALLFLFLSGSQALLEIGNAAALVISLCVIGAWCLIRERYIRAGIVCLALALVLKPQDAGFVWLYFLLAGGSHRRRAWQTLAVVAVLVVPSVIWMQQVSPHWSQELHANLVFTSAPGQVNDPTPTVMEPGIHGAMIISLQTVTSVFVVQPRSYNLVAYLVCAPFILYWAITVIRTRSSVERDWFALAAIAPLSMLVCYHRQHDTRILLLTVPICAMLWAERSGVAKIALTVTAFAALASSNVILEFFGLTTYHMRVSATGFGGELLNASLGRPVTIALLAQSIVLVFCFVRRFRPSSAPAYSYSEQLESMREQEAAAFQTPALQ